MSRQVHIPTENTIQIDVVNSSPTAFTPGLPTAFVVLDGECKQAPISVHPESTRTLGGVFASVPQPSPEPFNFVPSGDVNAITVYTFDDKATVLVCLVSKPHQGDCVSKVAFWPAQGFMANARLAQYMLQSDQFTSAENHQWTAPGSKQPTGVSVKSEFQELAFGQQRAVTITIHPLEF